MAILIDGNDWYSRTAFFADRTRTWMAWMYPTSLPSLYQVGVGAVTGVFFSLHNNGTNTRWSIGTSGSDFDGTSTVNTNTWKHLAIAQNGNAKTLYLDGVSEATGSDAETSSNDLAIGDYELSDNGNEWLGRIAAIKAWDDVLTQADIQQEMWQYLPVRTTNLLGFYPFLSTGDDEIDFSGLAKTLTVTGAPATADGPPIPWRQGRRRVVIPTTAAAAKRYLLVRN